MNVKRRVRLGAVEAAIPRGLKTIYNAHSAGRLPWASRVNNEGRRTRNIWVDLDLLQQWAADEGISLNRRLIEEAGQR